MSTASPAPAATTTRPLKVAFIGNPNTGKSTLFNALAGMQSRVGNFPGVTVEKKIGRVKWDGRPLELIDLPGTYSLAPRTLDEMVSVDVLLGRQADVGEVNAVVCIVDASNLERNLYLFSQVLDLGLPTVLVLNMTDVARTRGITIYTALLSERLGVPVVCTEAHKRRGMDELRTAIIEVADTRPAPAPRLFPPEFYQECDQLAAVLTNGEGTAPPAYLLERLILDVGGYVEERFERRTEDQLAEKLTAVRQRLQESGCRIPAVEARVRYAWVREQLDGVLNRPQEEVVTTSDRIDRLLTHRLVGLMIFSALMFLVFMAIYAWAEPLMGLIEGGQEAVAGMITAAMPPGALRSLLVDGVVAGVGGVIVFVPQIAFLFFFIALLEDCGYMARAAFLMDKLMTRIGLSGKSFVPLMSSFACAIPGVMATRVIENRRDRMVTILVAPLMSCSARLPVYVLLIALFIPEDDPVKRGATLFAMYSLGVLVAIPMAWLLKKTFFKGETPPFVMELPSYKFPSPRIVLHRVYDRSKAFVVRAGTLIFATTILVWAAGYFPGDHSREKELQTAAETVEPQIEEVQSELEDSRAAVEILQTAANPEQTVPPQAAARYAGITGNPLPGETEEIEAALEKWQTTEAELAGKHASLETTAEQVESQLNQVRGELIAGSVLGRVGHAIEPVVKPLGWDWKIGVGAIASFPAREVIVATLGTIYSLGGDVDEEDEGLRSVMAQARWPDGTPVYTIPTALSIMVFFALCAQCAATLMIIRRETNSWRWPIFTFTYMTVLAYVGALITYQVANLFV